MIKTKAPRTKVLTQRGSGEGAKKIPRNHKNSTHPKGRLGSLELPLNVATAPQRGANPHSRRRERVEGAKKYNYEYHYNQKNQRCWY